MMYTAYLLIAFLSTTTNMTFDFGNDKAGRNWSIVNDGVMGGLSDGNVKLTDNSVIFSGSVSLENNGGFTSFRAPYDRYDLSDYDKVEVKYRSTGLNCALSMDQYRRFWRPNYKMSIPSSDNEWKTLSTNLYELSEYQMGRKTGDLMSEAAAKNTIRLGIITDSKKAGEFMLEIAYIKFFKSAD